MFWKKNNKKQVKGQKYERPLTNQREFRGEKMYYTVAHRDAFEKAMNKAFNANEEAWKSLAKK